MLKGAIIFFCVITAYAAIGQTVKLGGRVSTVTNEPLPSAQIAVYPDSITTLSDNNGGFVINVKPGKLILNASFVGFEDRVINLRVSKDTTLLIQLTEKLNELNAVTVEDTRDLQSEIFQSNQTSTNVLTKEDITGIPVLGGEADVIKTLQLLPGTVKGVEGSSDLFVRGGAADQNLVLLDGAPIYNTSHLFGFLSVFNPDVLDKVEAINGGFPARYGGRLSSILNVNTINDIPDRTLISGDIGLIASRLFIEQPIIKQKASIWVAGRRTYIDQVVKAVSTDELPYFFYDINAKIILQPDANNHIELSHYGGEDILDWFRDRNRDGNGFLTTYASGNDSQSIQWQRNLKNNWNSSLSLLRSRYKYHIRNSFDENQLLASSDIEDYSVRLLAQKDSLFKNGTIRTGFEWTRHGISPNVINTVGLIADLLESSSSSGRTANEFAAHAEYEWSLTNRLRLMTGFRASAGIVANRNYFYPEPRVSARYVINNDQALKVSYSRMVQYIHRISNSAVTSPTDIWYPVTDSIQPQTAHQVALAWQRSLPGRRIFFSVETYYKLMNQLIGYEEGTNLFFNTDFESKLIQGKGKSYGLELLLRKEAGKFTYLGRGGILTK
jgi:hypothetical protein